MDFIMIKYYLQLNWSN